MRAGKFFVSVGNAVLRQLHGKLPGAKVDMELIPRAAIDENTLKLRQSACAGPHHVDGVMLLSLIHI